MKKYYKIILHKINSRYTLLNFTFIILHFIFKSLFFSCTKK